MPLPPTPTKCTASSPEHAPPRHRVSAARPSEPSARSAITRAASGPRKRPRRVRHARRGRPGSPASARIATASRSPVSSRWSITSAAPAFASTSAFFRWWSSVAVGSGTRIAGLPAAVISASVRRAGAADDQIGRLHLPVHLVEERLDASDEPGPFVALANQGQVALAGLVSDGEWPWQRLPASALPPHGHVDRVRALRAAKDQDSAAPRARARSRGAAALSRNSARTGLPLTNPFPLKYGSVAFIGHRGRAHQRARACRLVRPGTAFCSSSSVGMPRSAASATTGPELYPPTPDHESRPAAREQPPGVRRADSGSSADALQPRGDRLAFQSPTANQVQLESFARHDARFDPARRPRERHHRVGHAAAASRAPPRCPGTDGRPFRRPQSRPAAAPARAPGSRHHELHRRMHRRRMLRHVQQDAHADQVDEQRRPAGAHERQRDALGRHQRRAPRSC